MECVEGRQYVKCDWYRMCWIMVGSVLSEAYKWKLVKSEHNGARLCVVV